MRLAETLAALMRSTDYPYTPGLLARRSGVPKMTIVNWLEGRVERPRRWQDLARVAAALRLGPADALALLQAGGYPLAALTADMGDPVDRALLEPWLPPAPVAADAPPRSEPPHRLPRPITPLVGRAEAVAEVASLLGRPELRLLTLTGPGGIGKTRLAIAAASAAHRRFADGAHFVALAAIADAELVSPTIIQALGLGESRERAPRERLLAHLGERAVLLVLDNCEQIPALAPHIAELLAAAPGLKILCTSRSTLRLSGEWEYPVPPLAVPAPLQASRASFADDRRLAPDDPRPTTDNRRPLAGDHRPTTDNRRPTTGGPPPAAPRAPASSIPPPEPLSELSSVVGRPSSSEPPVADLGQIAASPAVQLFVGRVRMAQPGFGLHAENAEAVAEICRRLDGLPLALELAAARAKLFSPQALLARLEHRLGLLTGGAQDLPTRQQTLRATLDWSYGLLTGGERWLFRRAAVFSGSWSVEAAEAVAGPRPAEAGWVSAIDLLASLVDKSMVRQEPAPVGESRFVLLQTVREYAHERLVESGELPEAQARHARCFADLAMAAEPHLRRAEWQAWIEWLGRLDADYDNIRAALEWSLGPAAPADELSGQRLAGALGEYWWTRGLAPEGRRWIAAAIARRSDEHTPERAVALAWAGMLAQIQGDHTAAVGHCAAAVAMSEQLDDQPNLAWSLRLLGGVYWEHGDYTTALPHLERSLAICTAIGDFQAGARALHHLGYVALYRGDFAQADAYLDEGLRLCARLPYLPEVANSIGELLGVVARYRGDTARATDLLGRGIARFRQSGYRRGIGLSLYHLGMVALTDGDAALADARLRESLAQLRELGDRSAHADCLVGLAAASVALDSPQLAAQLLGEAAAMRERAGAPIRAIDRPTYDATLNAARDRLGDALFEAIYAAGALQAS